jgi:hypothetical protein
MARPRERIIRRTIRRQHGVGIARFSFYLALVIIALTIVLKLGPSYVEYLEIRSVMKGLAEDSSLAREGGYRLARILDDRLHINYIDSVSVKDFELKKTEKGYRVGVRYQVIEHLFANVDVLLNFHYEVLVDKK